MAGEWRAYALNILRSFDVDSHGAASTDTQLVLVRTGHAAADAGTLAELAGTRLLMFMYSPSCVCVRR